MAKPLGELPRWDTSAMYPGLDSEEYRRDFARAGEEIAALGEWFDEHGIRRAHSPQVAGDDEALATALAGAIERANAVLLRLERLGAFIYAHVSTDSYDQLAARELSRWEELETRLRKLWVRLQGWIGSLEPRLPELERRRPVLAEHAFFLAESARQSRHLMSEELEALAAELVVDGARAFSRLQGNLTSQIKVALERDGRTEVLPITVVRNLCTDPDPQVRERAYRAELEGWRSVRTAVAACLNAIKGTALTLSRRRGYRSVLEQALEDNRIDRETLDALLGAIRESFPVFRRYLRSKARKLGREQLPWWDLFAPLGATEQRYDWAQARAFIVEQFGRFSERLAAFAARAFAERWIDAEPRDGKRPGAFCMGIAALEQSRILCNYDGSFDQLSTVAHELGHGFHNLCQEGLPPLRRGAPATLAETASILCETLVTEAALEHAAPGERLAILETQLAGATQVCLDIYSRFLFESAVFERRPEGELGPDELCELMRHAQAETYAEAVDPETYHPYMWLWKPHYYGHEQHFYNFPYAFGHLFGLGLYAVYRREGAAFVPRYEELLRATGEAWAEPLAARFGIAIRTPEFWRSSLAVIERMVERYEAL